MASSLEGKRPKIKKTKRLSFPFLMSIGTLLAWSMVAGIIDTTRFQQDQLMNFAYVFGIVGVLGLIFSHRYLIWAGLLVFIGFLIFVFSGFYYFPEEANLANQFADLLTMTVRYIWGLEEHRLTYERVTIGTISFLFSFVVVIFGYYRFRFWVLFVVSVGTFSLLITSSAFSYYRSFYVFILCLLALFISYLHQRSVAKFAGITPATKYVLPMAVIPLLIAEVVPIPQAGFLGETTISQPFTFLNNTLSDFMGQNNLNQQSDLPQQGDFTLRQIGFNQSGGRLGGDMVLNDNVFMRLQTSAPLPLYLTGSIKDTYTGDRWINRYSDYVAIDFSSTDQNLEMLEHFSSAHLPQLVRFIDGVASEQIIPARYFPWYHPHDVNSPVKTFFDEVSGFRIQAAPEWEGYWNLFFIPNQTEIDVLDAQFKTVFHAGIIDNVFSRRNNLTFLRDRDRRLMTEQPIPENTRYTIVSYRETTAIGFDAHLHRLQHSYRGVLQDISYMLETFRQITGYQKAVDGLSHNGITISYENLLNSYLIPRSDEIYQIYTWLPANFPTRVQDLAVMVTEGAANDFERMLLLERYLSQNYTYTLTPGRPPRARDFVEHFLFDIREGYCTYFATAFVTMARSLGMPARYVEGFLVSGEPAEDGFIDVLNNMGHAWAEVYFEGFGWHRFEPTPRSGVPHSPEWFENALPESEHGLDEHEIGENQEQNDDPEQDEDELEETEEQVDDSDQDEEGENVDSPPTPQDESQQPMIEELASHLWLWVTFGISLFVLLILVRLILIHVRNWRRKKAGNQAAVIDAFDTLLFYLKFFKFQMEANETASLYVDRVCAQYFDHASEGHFLKEATAVFTKARYSNQAISTEEREVVASAVRHLEAIMKSSPGRWRYFFYRYPFKLKTSRY